MYLVMDPRVVHHRTNPVTVHKIQDRPRLNPDSVMRMDRLRPSQGAVHKILVRPRPSPGSVMRAKIHRQLSQGMTMPTMTQSPRLGTMGPSPEHPRVNRPQRQRPQARLRPRVMPPPSNHRSARARKPPPLSTCRTRCLWWHLWPVPSSMGPRHFVRGSTGLRSPVARQGSLNLRWLCNCPLSLEDWHWKHMRPLRRRPRTTIRTWCGN